MFEKLGYILTAALTAVILLFGLTVPTRLRVVDDVRMRRVVTPILFR